MALYDTEPGRRHAVSPVSFAYRFSAGFRFRPSKSRIPFSGYRNMRSLITV